MPEMTVIDFHVHFFPDAVAAKAVQLLSETGHVAPLGNGTSKALIEHMHQNGIAYSVNQPVATKPEQVVSINRQMIDFNKKSQNVLSFGTMHPQFIKLGKIREEIEYISKHGIKGIKMHPEYQEFYPDAPEMAEVYEACRDFGIMIIFHSGKDLAFQDVHGTPQRFAEVAKVKGLKVILGHMGGYQMWDDVEKYLVGLSGVYFDTAFSLEMEDWQMKEIIQGHGAYNILFASDFPWQKPINIINKIKELDLGADAESWIFHKNAKWLLELSY